MSVFTSAVLQGLNAIDHMHLNDTLEPQDYNPHVTSSQLAQWVGSSPQVMQRILWKLSCASIITVKRGPGGGYRIEEEQLRTKTVLNVMSALGQPVYSPEGPRASDRVQWKLYDSLNVPLFDILS